MLFLGEKDVDSDEVQCIVANLIEKVNFYTYRVMYIHAIGSVVSSSYKFGTMVLR